MPVQCLTGARFNMNAEVLTWAGSEPPPTPTSDNELPAPSGDWVTYQDPITGEIYNDWKPGEGVVVIPDDPDTPDVDETAYDTKTIPCLARGIVDGGIRVAGSTERFGDMYENIDFVKLWVPAHIKLKKSDRITNIRDRRNGHVLWKDDEDAPIIFNVNGVVPLFNAFNKHVESFVLLERADATA